MSFIRYADLVAASEEDERDEARVVADFLRELDGPEVIRPRYRITNASAYRAVALIEKERTRCLRPFA